MTDQLSRMQAYERSHEDGSNSSANASFASIVEVRFARRDLLAGALAALAISPAEARTRSSQESSRAPHRTFRFTELNVKVDGNHHVAPGYEANVLIRWGDPVLPGAPAFNPTKQTAAAQKLQFGYNCDFVGYFPLPGRDPSGHGLLVANHEYTSEELMFPGLGRQDRKEVAFAGMTKEIVDVEMAAHGGCVIEVRKSGGRWQVVPGSRYARRIDLATPMRIAGPAAGDARLRTSADPEGRVVNGMVNNCSGGMTPWGTWLSGEENFHGYFWGVLPEGSREAANHKRYNVPSRWFNWGQYYDRFDIGKEPNEPNRFGWIVEIDPYDPRSMPRKRTALGRCKHEGAAGIVNRDSRYVIYLGDDERFEYVYRFVTAGRIDHENPAHNRDLLDEGVLSAARFEAGGSLTWLPLVFGQGPLTAANGFASQADVLIETRRAADLLGATKMDRPEDIEANPKTQRVYVMLTNNTRRKAEEINAANPRPENKFGHIVEMTPPDGDHAAERFTWDILVRCGDPAVADVGATFNPATSRNGWFGMPDNCAVDHMGRLWIATDGNTPARTGRNDGIWAMETEGPLRGTGKLFFSVPSGAEMCGPMFTPDDQTLFVAVQHPGEADDDDPHSGPATYENPSTRWPDFREDMPPRPSIVAITKRGGGKIGT